MDQVLLVVLIAVPAVLAVTLHEIAHGWVALQLGDTTAAEQGRLSLNPLRHVDPIGTVLVPATLYFVGKAVFGTPFFFGWAKPVPVRWQRLSPIRPGIALVAAAGPGANLLMLLAWVLIALVLRHAEVGGGLLIYMCEAGIIFNAAIMLINLVPIPPLDGSRIVTACLPPRLAAGYNRIGAYGLALVALLLVTGVLQDAIGPLLGGVARFIDAFGI